MTGPEEEYVEVGFIGLGAMGMPMARNLAERLRTRPRVYDKNPQALQAAAGWAQVCHSPRDVATPGGVVISMLPADAHVNEVALGTDGLAASPVAPFTYADFSTISPETIKRVAGELEKRGVSTIGGAATLGVAAAEKGALAVYVDGDEHVVNLNKPTFSAFAKSIFYIGQIGQAKLIKLMNNYLVALNVALTAEALDIGSKSGIDLKTIVELLQKGSANSYALANHFGKAFLADDIGPGKFGTDYMVKDLNILIDYCRSAHAPLMMGATAVSLYRGASASGYGKHYYPVILKWLQEKTGAKS